MRINIKVKGQLDLHNIKETKEKQASVRDTGSALLELNVPLCSRLDRKPLVEAAGPMTRHKIFLLTSSSAARPAAGAAAPVSAARR